jgi:hypothetical protein
MTVIELICDGTLFFTTGLVSALIGVYLGRP